MPRVIKMRFINRSAAFIGLLLGLFLVIAHPPVLAGTATPVTVPDVVGLSETEAILALEGQGLTFSIRREYDNRVDLGDVISQSPQANTVVEAGARITLTVSNGPLPKNEVPDVVGETLEAAEAILSASDFNMSVQTIYDSSQPLNVVIRQSPVAGLLFQQGSTVTVYFNQSPTAVPVIVPDVFGMPVNDAIALLEGAGFNVLVLVEPDNSVLAGTVLSQHPIANTEANTGSTITLLIALEYYDSRWVSPLSSER